VVEPKVFVKPAGGGAIFCHRADGRAHEFAFLDFFPVFQCEPEMPFAEAGGVVAVLAEELWNGEAVCGNERFVIA